jgi:hypothetical protein
MVTCLSVLTRLESLYIGFESHRSRPDRKSRRPPPPTRTLLLVLIELRFRGVGDYLEDLVAQIDAPLLDKFTITFFYEHDLTFETPQLAQFISRSPKFKVHDEARLVFPTGTLVSHIHRHLMGRSSWESYANGQIGSFRFWRKSAAHSFLKLSSLQ